jgi:transcriptional regulator with XRE-family HTH domain
VSCCAVIGAARLTLEQLAEMSGVSARTLSDMERGRSKGPQHRTVTPLADTLALEGDVRKQFVELARDGRLRDHWTRPAGLCELPRLVDDFTGRATELVWISELVYAESAPGAGVVAENLLRANIGNWLGALRSAADRGQHPWEAGRRLRSRRLRIRRSPELLISMSW